MRLSFLVIGFFSVTVWCGSQSIYCQFAASSWNSTQTDHPFSLEKIRKLIQIPIDDSTIVALLRKQGIDFTVSREMIDDLRKLGADPHQEEFISTTLESIVGYLTVSPEIVGATVTIEGKGKYQDFIKNLDPDWGTYLATVPLPCYKVVGEKTEVLAGRATNLKIELEPDPEIRGDLLAQIREAFQNKNYNDAIRYAIELLSLDKNNAEALTIMAQCYYATNQFDQFSISARKAIEAGGEVVFTFRHHHKLQVDLHPILIKINSRSFSFDPQTDGKIFCTFYPFTVPIKVVGGVELVGNLKNEVYLQLKIRGSEKKNYNIKLADKDSLFVQGAKPIFSGILGSISYRGLVMQSRPEAYRALFVICELLKQTIANQHQDPSSKIQNSK